MPGSSALLFAVISLTGSTASAMPPVSLEALRPPPMVARCGAPSPALGRPISGTVLQVIDGQTLCVARGPTPAEWTRVTVAGAPADAGRGAMMAAAFGQKISCRTVRSGPDGAVARCAVNGAALDQLLGTDAVRAAGRTWR